MTDKVTLISGLLTPLAVRVHFVERTYLNVEEGQDECVGCPRCTVGDQDWFDA